jgi:hypothetical protein
LAALDVHTAKWIVDKCFKGDLIKGRTVILVVCHRAHSARLLLKDHFQTHNVALATPIAHFVVSLTADGRIATQGSISEALHRDRRLASKLDEGKEAIENAEEEEPTAEPITDKKKSDGKLIVAEDVAVGRVSCAASEHHFALRTSLAYHSAVKLFMAALSGRHAVLFWTAFVCGSFLNDLMNAFQSWWLGHWATQYEIPGNKVEIS